MNNQVSLFFHKFLDILTLAHPIKTAFGALFGILFICLSNIFSQKIEALGINVGFYTDLFLFVFFILLINIRTLIKAINGKTINEDFDNLTLLIDNSPLTDAEKRAKYRALIDKQIDLLDINKQDQDNTVQKT
ncbi:MULTISPECIES: hypothetical protein [Providencia]|uniref:hypothetical protein n=1 Tax=Providencia TaxID=586 RepID=UPI00234BBFBF|nr:hypothetical protein [Providencia sp. PROV038]